MCGDYQFFPSHSKASLLSRLSHKYIHSILSKLMIGCGDNTGLLSRLDLLYPHSMSKREPLYLGHVVANYLGYQSQYLWIGALFSRPYIAWLIHGMGLFEAIWMKEKIIIPTPLGLPTLQLMGVVRRTGIDGYTLVEKSYMSLGRIMMSLEPDPYSTWACDVWQDSRLLWPPFSPIRHRFWNSLIVFRWL